MNTKQRALAFAGVGAFGLFALMSVANAQEAPTTTAPTLEAPSTTAPDADHDGDCPEGHGPGRGRGPGMSGGGGGGGGTADTAPSTGNADNVGFRV